MTKTIIKNATILSMDPEIGDTTGDILIEGSQLKAVGGDLGDGGGAQVVDAAGLVAIPGMIDCHRHMWQGAIGGVAAGFCLNDYFATVLGKLNPQYRPDDAYAGVLFSGVDALNAGVTTLVDWSHVVTTPDHADECVRGHRDAGARIIFCYGFPVGLSVPDWVFNSTLNHPDDAARMRRDVLSNDGADELITMGLALRGPGMAHPDTTDHDIRFGRDLAIPFMSMHAGEPEFHPANQTIKVLRDRGLMGPDLHFVHGNQFDAEDLKILVDADAGLTATPVVELEMGLGFPMITPYIEAGGTPSLGVDTVTGTGPDLMTQMRAGLAAERARVAQPTLDAGKLMESVDLTPRDFLYWATMGGAKAINLDDRIGSLTPGKQADVVLMGIKAPMNDPATTIVTTMDTSHVDTVIVGGQIRKQAGAMLNGAYERAAELVKDSRDYVVPKADLAETVGPAWA